MAVKWTEEQQSVIDTRNSNILVSAAAGSGKTAVLVARILAMITDEKKSTDIDRLLVLTFTNAAAAEMRERIRDALEQRAEAEPDNVHLQRQLVLIHNAKITTIHSFCLNVLRNHFQTAGIDPSFRVADEGEILLLEQETAAEVIEEAYAEKTEEFLEFLESAATGKDDRILEKMILQLYHFALGQPWPEKWLGECRGLYATGQPENGGKVGEKSGLEEQRTTAEEPEWIRYIIEDTEQTLWDIQDRLEEALRIAQESDGPYMYVPMLESDLEMLDQIVKAADRFVKKSGEQDSEQMPEPQEDFADADQKPAIWGKRYSAYAEAFYHMPNYAVLSRKKDEDISQEKRELVKAMRDETKSALAVLRQKYFYDKPEVLRKEFLDSGTSIRALTHLVEAFIERIAEKKAEKNILDFGDLEHLALKILVEQTEQGLAPSAAAREYAESFDEIMTDEYQDSNLVQELILNSVAGRGKGEANRFMVGDVKQSIYRFRLARPELFMEKYRTYRGEEKDSCRIDLHRNFRSRAEVLEGINEIFEQIMTEKLGGIGYDADAALYPGAVFEPIQSELLLPEGRCTATNVYEKAETEDSECQTYTSEQDSFSQAGKMLHATELWLLETDSSSKQKMEAQMVGQRIQELVGQMPVWDKEEGCYRPARYSDIVILLRTVSGWSDVFQEVLSDMGIPCFTGSQKGYFSAAEIRIVLSYLQLLDNPIQDIPLAAVLRSAIGRLTDEELAKIRAASEKRSFYDSVNEYRRQGTDTEIQKKLERFFDVFDRLRAKSAHTPVHLLLWEILDATGYGEYAAALPGGSQRKANLDMLVEKAVAYESTSYRGVYHFVRYIENLKKYEVDYGEANVGQEADDTVRIISIHKSKGLEYPIVFVSGMAKQFNEMDVKSKLAAHPELGIACDFVDTELRIRQATLLKKVIQRRTMVENLGEELRVLYVAMTRAKEKLILTGTAADLETAMGKWNGAAGSGKLSYSWLSSASNYLDWVVPAMILSQKQELFELHEMQEEQLLLKELQETGIEQIRLAELLDYDTSICHDEQTRAYLENVFSSVYPYEAERAITGKLSVSELKKSSYIPEATEETELYPTEEAVPLIPRFRLKSAEAGTMQQEEADAGEPSDMLHGAARGTAYHTFLENLDFSKKDELQRQLEELISCGKMSQEEGRVLRFAAIRRFLYSDCGRRMEEAAQKNWLYREHPFVIGVPANEIQKEWSSDEIVLVQGIIDAYFMEADGTITIVDYKTDHVFSPQILVDRYRVQLDYYARALEQLTGCRVKDRIIYSFQLGREIHVPAL